MKSIIDFYEAVVLAYETNLFAFAYQNQQFE